MCDREYSADADADVDLGTRVLKRITGGGTSWQFPKSELEHEGRTPFMTCDSDLAHASVFSTPYATELDRFFSRMAIHRTWLHYRGSVR